MLEVEFAQLSDTGRAREHNEDYIGYFAPASPAEAQSHGWLFALADGVGGQDLGEVASRTAVESLLANFRKSAGGESPAPLLRRLIQAANHEVYEAGRSAGPGGVAMATTMVACALRYDRAVVGHVGDSRCYLIRDGGVTLLTRDHTVVGEQARLGLISGGEASVSQNRHLLSRSLGNDLFVQVDTGDHPLQAGDVLLLCSDGLHNAVTESDIAQLLYQGVDLAAAVRGMVEFANARDGGDNISVQAVRIRSVERVGMYRGRPYKIR